MLVQSWYQGGVSVIDWTNPRKIKELAWFDRGPFAETTPITLAGFWSTYYNGRIFGSEIQRGFDVFEIRHKRIKGAKKFNYDTLNAQTQEQFQSSLAGPGVSTPGPSGYLTQNQGVVVRFPPSPD